MKPETSENIKRVEPKDYDMIKGVLALVGGLLWMILCFALGIFILFLIMKLIKWLWGMA